jgi:hypothetical protein
MGKKIKVSGYAQKVTYGDGIEYRDFTPDLVGNQLTDRVNVNNPERSTIFSSGGFLITTNLSEKIDINIPIKPYSGYHTLSSLNTSKSRLELLFDSNTKVSLNLKNSDLSSFAYFGSSIELVRVSLENIILNWPASIYVSPYYENEIRGFTGYTAENYIYDTLTNVASFKINTNFIVNNFELNYQATNNTVNTFTQSNILRDLSVYYDYYTIDYNNNEYNLVGFTGSTSAKNSYIYLEVEGDIFSGSPTTMISYHIRPINSKIEQFFNNLTPFENNLLNRQTRPKYTSYYDYTVLLDDGSIIETNQYLTWPVSDGYNIDFNTFKYSDFVLNLLKICEENDDTSSDLIVRYLVSDSIAYFDRVPRIDGNHEGTASDKVRSLLRIYGREFDEVKKYIDSIKLAHTVTYDKQGNSPDQTIKYLASALGWDLTNSIVENDLMKLFLDKKESSYSGHTVGLSLHETEIEIWRRLVINSAWLWKSKGTRKPIEFFFKFLGAPKGLFDLNEYVYRVKNKLDVDLFKEILRKLDLTPSIANYNIDDDGYPKFLPNNDYMFFQKGGGWYRETGGNNSNEFTSNGNNPHIGPYDYGKEYLNQLTNLIPNAFKPVTVTNKSYITLETPLFSNYFTGTINAYTGNIFVDVTTVDGVDKTDVYTVYTTIEDDPYPSYKETDCGCQSEAIDDMLSVCLEKKQTQPISSKCDENLILKQKINGLYRYNVKYIDPTTNTQSNPYDTIYRSKECCSYDNGYSYEYDEYSIYYGTIDDTSTVDENGDIVTSGDEDWRSKYINKGYICCTSPGVITDTAKSGCGSFISCKWRLASDNSFTNATWGDGYLKFISPNNNWGVTGNVEYKYTNPSDSGFCPKQYTTDVIVNDPVTGVKGFACKLTSESLKTTKINAVIKDIYTLTYQKSIGKIDCYQTEL